MAKARKFGYFGACDSIESLKMVAQDAVDLKIIPEVSSLSDSRRWTLTQCGGSLD